MVLADGFWPSLPANPTWIFVVCLTIVVGYFLARIAASLLRSYTANQQIQINGLRDSLEKQADRHAQEMRDMRSKIDRLETVTEEARTERHRLRGENYVLRMAVDIVRDLYTRCTCQALAPVEAVLDNISTKEET